MNSSPEIAESTVTDLANECALRIDFARDTLRSIQALIQFLDQKCYLILVIISVTSAAFFSAVLSILKRHEVLLSPMSIGLLMAAWFLIEAGLVLLNCLKSIQGVIANPVAASAPRMVYPHSLLEQYGGDAERYFERLYGLRSGDILRDYSAEIIKTSSIYVEKALQVNDAVKALYRSMFPWIIGILTSVTLRVM